MLTPTTVAELIDLVRSHPRVLAVGARTKPRLSAGTDATLVDLRGLAGIVEYHPSEYTITVRAGTRLTEINAALAAHGQYLPFDPPLAAAGATLGGTVAANLAGPGRFRFGGVRDFILGVTLLDGTGRLLRGGGKVVKNAAGFDLPKLLTGSLGRLGILTELTFKVFPRPAATHTRRLTFATHEAAITKLAELARSRFEPDALDYLPAERALLVRLAGPAAAVDSLGAAIGGEAVDESVWAGVADFDGIPADHRLVKVPVTPRAYLALQAELDAQPAIRVRLTAGGATANLACPPDTPLPHAALTTAGVRGLVLRGDSDSLWLGRAPDRIVDLALTRVFDPDARFPHAA